MSTARKHWTWIAFALGLYLLATVPTATALLTGQHEEWWRWVIVTKKPLLFWALAALGAGLSLWHGAHGRTAAGISSALATVALIILWLTFYHLPYTP